MILPAVVIVAQRSDGLEVTLKASGPGRFFGAAFLMIWLAFWVVGEVLVGSILFQGGWSLLTGLPPGEGRAPLETAPAIVAGVLLLGWLAFWTLGGVLAGKELLRLLFGRDRLVLGPDSIMVERGFGLVRERQTMPRVSVRRFHRRLRGHAVGADTDHGSVELSDLGAPDVIDRLVAALNTEWRLDPDAPRTGLLPEGWNEARAPEGDAILIKEPSRRKKQAMVLWVVCLSLAAVGGHLLFAATAPGSLRVVGLIIAAGAAFAGWGAYRLSWCRDEWVLGNGSLRMQRRIRGRAQPRFEAAALRLEEHSDSDGDLWYKLVALDAGASPSLPIREARRHECGVMSAVGDPTDVHNLGRWLAERCGLPLEDATTGEGRAREAERLRQQLAASGQVGRWMARRLRPEPGERHR